MVLISISFCVVAVLKFVVCSSVLQGSGVLGSKVMRGMVFKREVEGTSFCVCDEWMLKWYACWRAHIGISHQLN